MEASSLQSQIIFKNLKVVSEFLKGNHSKIKALKDNMAICKTRFHRPDFVYKIKVAKQRNKMKNKYIEAFEKAQKADKEVPELEQAIH